jgi:ElaA protein
MPSWQCYSFQDLTIQDLNEILRARQIVFAVEQNCVYLDANDLDRRGLHLLGWEGEGRERELVV